jgi:hypothetical protein
MKSILTARRISNSKAQGTHVESSVMNAAVFLKISATGGHNMGGWRTRGSVSYHNIPLSRKEHEIPPLPGTRRNV